jgi:tetratricopeptide (TPR) repeat protein
MPGSGRGTPGALDTVMFRLAVALAVALQAPVQSTPPASPSPAQAPERLDAAEARYRAAIALNPNIAAYHESLALVLERNGQIPAALAEHRLAVRLDSVSARNRAGLGSLLLRQGSVDEAIVHLSAASAADPSSVPVRMELARALVSAKRTSEAQIALEQARALAPNDSSIARAIAGIGPVTAPGEGYHDYSGFADDGRAGRWFRVAMERGFAVVLGLAALALIAPIIGSILVVALEMPRRMLARRGA